ncbi:hypothetical protein EDB87DRAFT_535640 [Lactarius vividus]|nr:hypothetical protein EDB87DRAFT_535640 [Lactarius vividus]
MRPLDLRIPTATKSTIFPDHISPPLLLTLLRRLLLDEKRKYARAVTHFLLYVYDNLRNALLDCAVSRGAFSTIRAGPPTASDAFFREVLPRPAEIALWMYSPGPYDAEGESGFNGWDTLARRWRKPTLRVDGTPTVQREVFRAVHVL